MLRINFQLIIFLVFTFSVTVTHALPTAKVTIKVVDEQGQPLNKAKVGVAFQVPQGLFGGKPTKKIITGKTGTVTISGNSMGFIEYGATREGYYGTARKYTFKEVKKSFLSDRYSPWDPELEVVLKKKLNPVSLYIRDMRISGMKRFIKLPEMDKNIGFDLLLADWVKPYGLGETADFVFHMSRAVQSPREFDVTLKLSFSHKGDGIQNVSAPVRYTSRLRLPHRAPTKAYRDQLVQRYVSTINHFSHQNFPEDRNYFYRVRSQLDAEGNIVGGLYGKIHGNIKFNELGEIGFIYYLNPRSNDSNLEFDLTKNLATGQRAEMVFTP